MKIPGNWRRCECALQAGAEMWYAVRPPSEMSNYRARGEHHDNPFGPCMCGAMHNYEPDHRDILIF